MVEIFQSNEVFDVKEVALKLKRPEATIRDWIHHRTIPFYKVNGRVTFYGQVLNEWYDSKLVAMVGGDSVEVMPSSPSATPRSRKGVVEKFNDRVAKLK